MRGRLEALAADLRASGIAAGETAYVDDRPLAERALAARAGLGWIGKNTNLLTHERAGSWVFLGAILTSAELSADAPVRTSCGSCTRCLTAARPARSSRPRTIDARRCISYLTIEHPGALDAWEAAALGDWIFGCDVCQEVCPVNADADDSGPLRVPLLPLIEWLLPMGTRAFERALGATALTRAGRHRLLRNAIAALGNAGPLTDGGAALAGARRPRIGARRCGSRRSRVLSRVRGLTAADRHYPCARCLASRPSAGCTTPSTASAARPCPSGCAWPMTPTRRRPGSPT